MKTATFPKKGPALLVLHEFRRSGLRYCIWRGASRLEASLSGRSDLDVLIDVERLAEACHLFGRFGFRRARTSDLLSVPGLHDFFAFDASRSCLVHVHLHCRLAAGEKRFNRFRLPWERDVLETRTSHGHEGLWVADPAADLVLLLVRKALSLRCRDRLPGSPFRSTELRSVNADRRVLLAQTDRDTVLGFAMRWLGDAGRAVIDQALSVTSLEDLRRLRWVAKDALAAHTSAHGVSALARRWYRDVILGARSFNRRWPRLPLFSLRGGGAGGLLVAIVGPDTKKVATLGGEIRSLFGSKFDVAGFAFGKHARAGAFEQSQETTGQAESRLVSRTDVLKSRFRALVERRRLRRAAVARNRGMLVICQGYPGIDDTGRRRARSKRAAAFHCTGSTGEPSPCLFDGSAPDVILSLPFRGGSAGPPSDLDGDEPSAERLGHGMVALTTSRSRAHMLSEAVDALWKRF